MYSPESHRWRNYNGNTQHTYVKENRKTSPSCPTWHYDLDSPARITPVSNPLSWFQWCSSHWISTVYIINDRTGKHYQTWVYTLIPLLKQMLIKVCIVSQSHQIYLQSRAVRALKGITSQTDKHLVSQSSKTHVLKANRPSTSQPDKSVLSVQPLEKEWYSCI